MKSFAAFGLFILLMGGADLASAQSKTPTPVKLVSAGAANQAHNINFRLRQDMMQINKDVHSGKLTKAQATALRTQILAVRKQELADVKSNGNKQLTADQEAQLGQLLSQLETSL